ncbi:MAG: DUF3800 domain-containing protein [Terriglobales bacterium]
MEYRAVVRKSQLCEISRFEHIVSHRENPKAVYVAALTVYFDDSGTHKEAPIAVVAGWISPVPQWKKFVRDWKKAVNDEGFKVFHMAEFMANNHKSEFADKSKWNDAKKLRVVRRLRQIIAQRSVRGFGITVHKKDYDELVQGELRNKFGEFHYSWAVNTVIGLLENWRASAKVREPIEYIFDRMSEGRKEIDQIFINAESEHDSLNRYGIYKGCHSFRDKADILPLQASDMMAWLLYQRGLNDVSGKKGHPLTVETFDYFNQRNFKGGSFSRINLAELMKAEKQAIDSGVSNKVQISFSGMRYAK